MSTGGDSPTSPVFSMGGAVGVTRSRTLPSSRRRGDSGATGSNPNVNTVAAPEKERERSRLLKKQKRASMVTPSSQTYTSTHSQPHNRRTSQIMTSGHAQQGSV